MIDLPVTATLSGNLAKEIGLPAALLYNQLLYTSQTKSAKIYD